MRESSRMPGGRPACFEAKLPVEPKFLLGRKVTVKFDNGNWYSGAVEDYNSDTFEHKVVYDDGDEEWLLVGTIIPIKIHCGSKEQLPRASAELLQQVSFALIQDAEQDEAAAAQASGPSVRRQKLSSAERKKAKARELLQVAEDTAQPPPPAPAPSPNRIDKQPAAPAALIEPDRPAQSPEQPAASAAVDKQPSPRQASDSGELSEALLAAQQLLQSIHPANVPGLGFSKVEWPWQKIGPNITAIEAQHQLDEQRQQQKQQAAGMGSDLLGLDQELQSAYEQHLQSKHQHAQYYKELDVSLRLTPEELVGRDVRIYWQLDDAWFRGTVSSYDSETARHMVSYEDGTTGQLWLGTERVRLLYYPGEQLPTPDANTLKQLAHKYSEQAELLEQKLQQQAAKQGGTVTAGSSIVADDDDSERPGLLHSKAQMLLAAAHIKQQDLVPDVWVPLAARLKAGSGGSSRKAMAVAAGSGGATPAGSGGFGAAGAAAPKQAVSSAAAAAALASTFSSPVRVRQTPGETHSGQQQQQQQAQPPQQRGPGKRQAPDPAIDSSIAAPTASVAAAGHTRKRQKQSTADVAGGAAVQEKPTVLQELQQQQQQQQPPLTDSGNKLVSKSFHKKRHSAGARKQQGSAAGSMTQQQTGDSLAELLPQPQQQELSSVPQALQQQKQRTQRSTDTSAQQTQLCAGTGSGTAAGGGSNSSDACSVLMSVLPGDVVWVQSKSAPIWPATVISSEEAADFSVPSKPKVVQVCVQYFGEYTRGRVHPSSLIPPCVALEQRVWIPRLLSKTNQKMTDTYKLALRELIEYCKTGQLPDPEMVPEHNDERWLTDIDDTTTAVVDAAAAATAEPASIDTTPDSSTVSNKPAETASKSKSSRPPAAARTDHSSKHSKQPPSTANRCMSLKQDGKQVSSNLVLLSLGRIEFLHPGFHTEKFMYPVGFRVNRKARSPASGGSEVWHLCEILEQPDGSGPLFRITPQGSKPASGSSPTAAWEQLYKSAAPAAAADTAAAPAAVRAVSTCGAKLFGLQHPAIRELVQALPNAAACDKFMAWQGVRPLPVQLTQELQLAKRAIATKLLSLPQGIAPQPLRRRMVSACDACGDEIEIDTAEHKNLLVECDKCRVVVHMRCYGLSEPPNGRSWLCDVCRLPGLTSHPPCALCPRIGGAMKVTADGGWCHLMCATWVPGMCVADAHKMEPIIGRVHKDHRSLLCSICKQPYGACIQCAGSGKCYASFHPTCAREAGYPMAAVIDADSDSESDTPEPAATAAASGGYVAKPGADGVLQQQQQMASSKAKGPKQHRRLKKVRKEGTAAGDNTRLFCFCPKHQQKSAELERNLVFETSISSTAAPATAAAAADSGQILLGSASNQGPTGVQGVSSSMVAASGAAAGVAPAEGQEVTSPRSAAAGAAGAAGGDAVFAPAAAEAEAVPQREFGVSLFADGVPAGTCARSRPADTAVRRGLRAPDALAAALKKRLYVRPLPYLVTGSTQVGRLLPPPVARSRTRGPEFDWDRSKQQQHELQDRQQGPQQQRDRQGQEPQANGSIVDDLAAAEAQRAHLQQEARAAVTSSFAGCGVSWGGFFSSRDNSMQPMSLADRYQLMTDTVCRRITSGKSAIHGLGVFAKVPHKAGDMIVEYIGNLVRPRVADILEARTYNKLVGAGTYVFRLNDNFLVDATRAGNIAHLINHSCAPSCVSKTYTIQCPHTGERQDHVVIVAKRDIVVGEEFTYDYRFAGDERLRCNCGAQTCRGWVNNPTSFDSPMKRGDGSLLVPSRELVRVKRSELVVRGKPAAAHDLL